LSAGDAGGAGACSRRSLGQVSAKAHMCRRFAGLRVVAREAPCRGALSRLKNRLTFRHLAKHVVVDVWRNARRNEYAGLERHLVAVGKEVHDDDLVGATGPLHKLAGEVSRVRNPADKLGECFSLLTGYVIASS
jgi:hypothetical protein